MQTKDNHVSSLLKPRRVPFRFTLQEIRVPFNFNMTLADMVLIIVTDSLEGYMCEFGYFVF